MSSPRLPPFCSASFREGRVALSVGHPHGTHSRYVIGCCLIPLEICGVKNNSRRITYGIGCIWGMPSLSPWCDRRWLPVFGCTYEAINSMWDLVHSWAVCKLFFVKSLIYSLSQKSHTNVELWNTSLLFDLNYKFINGSLAFSPG